MAKETSNDNLELSEAPYIAHQEEKQTLTYWKPWHRVAFRIAFIFFIALSFPNSVEWYKHVANIDWTNLHYRDLYDIARFGSGINLLGNSVFGSTLLGYANWIITLLISVVAGLIWTLVDSRRKPEPKEYNTLYYWLRVIVRYRAGIGIIGFGFTKLLPVQMPYPSYALLNTDFGDFTAQKIYWLSIGIVPWYQVFAGVVEVLAGALLFFRKTTLWGAALLFAALGDIVYVNFAYDGGVHGYSSYFVVLSGFLLVPYLKPLYQLLVQQKPARFNFYYPDLSASWIKWTRAGLKTAVLYVFLVLLFYLQYVNFKYDPYKQPSTAGVKSLRGNYTVTEFRLNDQVIPYNPLDSVRWQEATFENWTTLTFKVNKAVPIDLSNGGGDPQRDINRNFEITGTAGGRRTFHYYADTVDKVLYLQDKYKKVPDRRNRVAGSTDNGAASGFIEGLNKEVKQGNEQKEWISKEAWEHIGNEVNFIDERAASTRRNREFAKAPKNEKRKRMVLKYQTDDGNRIILTGTNENNDSIYVVLDKVERKYALSQSTLVAGKY
ncbi:hypothetical protein [Pedobacter sp. SYSU D00535]|uniref:hypothetical protein n=1 Tax=Pedobacter sp. SYSU D00535 TaxID=2810308 RepID=UPI001A95EE75|nr:hypothetical protein [Pedobacter sp. SYSU D00535]